MVGMEEIVFHVRGQSGKYIAEAEGASIVTSAASFDQLADMVRDAVDCHFDPGTGPATVRLVFSLDMARVP